MEIDGVCIKRAPRSEGFVALGTQITFDNCFDVELDARIRKAWGAFHKHKDILCCQAAPFTARMQLLSSLVEGSLFWCAGSWTLTKKQESRLRGVQRAMVWRMLRPRREEHETLEAFMRRANAAITEKITCNWDTHYHQLQYDWAGRLASLERHDPDRITLRVAKHKCLADIYRFADINRGRQGHVGRLHVWRWETKIYNYFIPLGLDWFFIAKDPWRWAEHLDSWKAWRRA